MGNGKPRRGPTSETFHIFLPIGMANVNFHLGSHSVGNIALYLIKQTPKGAIVCFMPSLDLWRVKFFLQ